MLRRPAGRVSSLLRHTAPGDQATNEEDILLVTDKQRRWWFAAHPEYRAGAKEHERSDAEKGGEEGKVSPEEVDAWVDEALKYASSEIIEELLRLTKRWFGTAGQTRESYEELGLEWPWEAAEKEYQKGWEEGYWSIHRGKAPPYLRGDKSPYAEGVRDGATKALDEREEWAQKWHDPILFFLGSHPERALRNELKKKEPPPSDYHDAHHLVPRRHWRAQPARDILDKFDIPLHGIENGMWLNRGFHQALSNSRRYMDAGNLARKRADSKGKKEVIRVLDGIRYELSQGRLPS
jgi:hypothetical protein